MTGATFGDGEVSAATTADPGRLARSAYTAFHLPMVAGIIAVAAAAGLVLVALAAWETPRA